MQPQTLKHGIACKWGISRQKIQAAKSIIPGVFCSVGCFLAANEPSALGRATQALQGLQQSTLSISSKAGQPQQLPKCMSQSVVQTMSYAHAAIAYQAIAACNTAGADLHLMHMPCMQAPSGRSYCVYVCAW